jgi:hypothetical protein
MGMKKLQSLFATLVAAASIAVVPAANAQTVHFVGAGSSAQYLTSALAADQIAYNNITSHNTGGTCTFHYTANSAANLLDLRDTLGRIVPEKGNLWVVWVATQDGGTCATSVGNTGVTHIWLDISVDSTVGVRTFLLTQRDGTPGAYAQIITPPAAPANNVAQLLWTDNNADVALPSTVYNAIGTSSAGTGDVQVNAGQTDIRAEDALAATVRSISALNTTTWAGLGYVGPTGNIGAPISSAQPGSTSTANPVKFALKGNDPISAKPVRSYVTTPLGAAPIVFAMNNGGTYNTSLLDLNSGINGMGTAGSGYALAKLFDGTTSCDTSNAAFHGGDGLATPLVLFLREPLSGTMNTTEYSLFRTTGNTKDSQEVGIINPTRAPYNPLNLACTGDGSRQRAIGTGEVVKGASGGGGILNTAHSMGYFFFSWGNIAKIKGSVTYQYFTIDGVDPIGATTVPGPNAQNLPNCTTTNCASSLWSGGLSYPNLRNGTYKAWSVYRWLTPSGDVDPYGPAAVAQSAQDLVDSSVADFVPFATSTNSDGLEVYHSHFTQSATTGNNGPATTPNTLDGGNTLGGVGTAPQIEAGGDEGGVILGYDFGTVNTAAGTGTNAGKCHVSWHSGRKFGFPATTATAWEGKPIVVNGVTYTVATTPAPTGTSLYATPNCGAQTAVRYSQYTNPAYPGTLNKKQ